MNELKESEKIIKELSQKVIDFFINNGIYPNTALLNEDKLMILIDFHKSSGFADVPKGEEMVNGLKIIVTLNESVEVCLK